MHEINRYFLCVSKIHFKNIVKNCLNLKKKKNNNLLFFLWNFILANCKVIGHLGFDLLIIILFYFKFMYFQKACVLNHNML